MTELEKILVGALRPFTFRLSKKDGLVRDDPWTDDPTKMTDAIICDIDVVRARKAVGVFDIAERREKK